jgi:hypothetical protein
MLSSATTCGILKDTCDLERLYKEDLSFNPVPFLRTSNF